MGDDDFNMEEWASKYKLTRPTTAALRKEDFKDKDLLCLMTIRDINRLEITAGQARALRVALNAIGNPIPIGDQVEEDGAHEKQKDQEESESRSQNVDQDPFQEAGEAINRFLLGQDTPMKGAAGGSTNNDQAASSFPKASFDPRMSLTVKAHKKKAHKITAFLQEAARERLNNRRKDRVYLAEGVDGSVSIKAEEAGRQYISVDEWAAANTRILAHLLEEGELARSDVEYYLAYTVNVLDLVPKFDWMSILDYDYRYRELQAQHGFPWGTTVAYLENRVLLPRRLALPAPPPKAKFGGAGKQTSQGQQDKTQACRLFATRGTCPFGAACRFRHDQAEPNGKNE